MNVDSPEFLANPYPFFAALRARSPVFRRSDFEWTLTGFETMSQILAQPAAGRGNIGQTPRPNGDTSELNALKQANPALQMLDAWMLFQNPPQHGETRGRIADVFTHKVVQRMEQTMRKTLQNLLAEIHSRRVAQFDFIADIAYRFPLSVMCELIGIPADDKDQINQWTRDFALAVQVDFHRLGPAPRAQLNQSADELSDYFSRLIEVKKESQLDDLMTRFINRNEQDLSEQELLANCVFLLFAGQETTTSLMGNAMLALLQHPAELEKLRNDLKLIPNAVEECLRYDPSIQMVGRYALDDFQVGEHKITKGQHIFAFLGAAGHDPAVNDDPNRFDVSRANPRHLAFTRGTHHCLGASLARLQMKILFEELVLNFSSLEQHGNAIRRPTWLMRGLESLPMRFTSC